MAAISDLEAGSSTTEWYSGSDLKLTFPADSSNSNDVETLAINELFEVKSTARFIPRGLFFAKFGSNLTAFLDLAFVSFGVNLGIAFWAAFPGSGLSCELGSHRWVPRAAAECGLRMELDCWAAADGLEKAQLLAAAVQSQLVGSKGCSAVRFQWWAMEQMGWSSSYWFGLRLAQTLEPCCFNRMGCIPGPTQICWADPFGPPTN
ncbi:UNVERIFIED_CONTAM: hypothetical protein Slati_2269600 [Sesamum latifolium]|uniref:Uncharacterized protein n=1 Tax=Sesamum latifolium TaxID=2727402 RepID=A0AAW2WAU8_9LAMI